MPTGIKDSDGTPLFSIKDRLHTTLSDTWGLDTPCDAIPAIKKCLLWLLDHSDIKKTDNSGAIAELKKQMEEINQKIKELEA